MLQRVEAEQSARSQIRVVGSAFCNAPVEQARDQSVLVDSEPGPVGAQILAADYPRPIAQRGRRQRGTVEIFVAIRRHHDRIVGEDAEVDCERAHGAPKVANPTRSAQGARDDRICYDRGVAAKDDRYEVVLIGAGIIGSSVAMGLAERGVRVAVVDIDLSGRLSSSEKNAGGVRATWWQPVNITLCRESIRYYESIREEVGFRQKGYLWLYDAETWPKACQHLEVQRALGHEIDALTPAEVSRRVPEIDRLEGIAGATFSPADGLINPNLLKEHYRARALKLGAQFLDRTYVVAIDAEASSVRLQCWQSDGQHTDDDLARLMTDDGVGEAQPAAFSNSAPTQSRSRPARGRTACSKFLD